MTFRWNAGLEAENIVAHFRLPIPNGQRCLMWDYYYSLERRQQRVPNFYTNYSSAFRFIADGPSTPEYKDIEGYPFHRVLQYLATAVALVGLTPERQDDLLRLISDYALKERIFYLSFDLSDYPDCWQEARLQGIWAGASGLGRRAFRFWVQLPRTSRDATVFVFN